MRVLLPLHPGTRLRAGLVVLTLLAAVATARAGTSPLLRPGANPRRSAAVEVVERLKNAVVNIHSERTVPGGDHVAPSQQRVNGMGTGIVIDPRGYVLTNHHVVEDVHVLRVRLFDGTNLPARVFARDPESDLAVLKIEPPRPLPTVPYGTASDLMQGEPVIAIGNAYGYEHTVTTGVVSYVKRDVSLNKDVSYKALIQTDASINPGNSGGPLLNVFGELIGVNVAIRAGAQGIGFAIPVDSALRSAAEMLSPRRRGGPAHGIAGRDFLNAAENPVKRSFVVERCEPNSPAARAGLQKGDVIERAGDVRVFCALDLERAFLERAAGDKVALVIRRGGSELGEGGTEVRAEVVLQAVEKASAVGGPDSVWRRLGVRVQPAAGDGVTRVNPQLHGGLSIVEVNPDGPAGKAGFQRGDVLIGLHQWETVTPENVLFVLNHPDLASFTPLKFFVIRGGKIRQGWVTQID